MYTNRNRKGLTAVLIVLAASFGLLVPVTVRAAESGTDDAWVTTVSEIGDSGTLGENGGITWTYSAATKTLTLRGEDELKGVYDRETSSYKNAFGDVYTTRDIEKLVFEDCTLTGRADYLCYGMSKLKEIDCSGLNTSAVTGMPYMFYGCRALTKLNLGNMDTAQVEYIYWIFGWCDSLTELDMSSFDLRMAGSAYNMLNHCDSLSTLKTPKYMGSEYSELPNPFCEKDASDTRYSRINADNTGMTLVRAESEKKAEGLSWDAGRACWSTAVDLWDFDYELYREKDGVCNMLTSGSHFGDSEKESGKSHSWDFSEYVSESGRYLFRVRAYKYRNEDWQWSDYCVKDYVKPQNSLDSPAITLGDKPGIMTFDTVDHAAGYRIELCYPNANGEIQQSDNRPFSLEQIGEYSSNTSTRWANAAKTAVYVDRSYQCEKGYDYFWRVRAYSEDIDTWANGDYGESEHFIDNTLGTNGNITYSYDEVMQVLTVTGEDELNGSPFAGICNSKKVRLIEFRDCKLTGSAMGLFGEGTRVEEIDLTGLDTSEVTDMTSMFNNGYVKKLTFGSLDTSNVTSMSMMFENAHNLTSLDLSCFDTGKVTDMYFMFGWCSDLKNLDLSSFDTSQVTNMRQMFYDCTSLETVNVSRFDTSKVTDMWYLFKDCKSLTALDLSSFHTPRVMNMEEMFSGCQNLISLDLSNFDITKADTTDMLKDCGKLLTLQTPRWMEDKSVELPAVFLDEDGTEYTKLSEMEEGTSITLCAKKTDTGKLGKNEGITWTWDERTKTLTISGEDDLGLASWSSVSEFAPISHYGIERVVFADCKLIGRMQYLFSDLTTLKEADLSGLDASEVTDMTGLFRGCTGLTKVILGDSLDTAAVKGMNLLFYNCTGLTELDLGALDTTGATGSINGMFSGCYRLVKLVAPRRMGSLTASLPNPFADSEGTVYSEMSAANAGKELNVIETNAKPVEVKWDGSKILWKMDPDFEMESELFSWELYFLAPGDDQMRSSTNGGGYFANSKIGDYYYQDIRQLLNESGKYCFRVAYRDLSGSNNWLWSDFSEFREYQRPAEAVKRPTIVAMDSQGSVTFGTVEHAYGYLITLYCKDEYYDRSLFSSYFWKEDFDHGFDSTGFGVSWTDDTHTQLIANVSRMIKNEVEDGEEYYWLVQAVSEDVDVYANGEPSYSASFIYEKLGLDMEGTITVNGGSTWDVVILVTDGTESLQATVSNGTYRISGVSEGTHSLIAIKDGYVTRSYNFTVEGGVVAPIDVELHRQGDVDGNGSADISDLNLMCSHIRGSQLLTGYERSCADVDGNDGIIDIRDLNRLCQHIRGADLLWE